jgi:hypothetical protein
VKVIGLVNTISGDLFLETDACFFLIVEVGLLDVVRFERRRLVVLERGYSDASDRVLAPEGVANVDHPFLRRSGTEVGKRVVDFALR